MNKCRSLLQRERQHNREVYDDKRKSELPAYAWPGGYTLIYVWRNGATTCAECATRALNTAIGVPDRERTDLPIDYSTYDEGPTIECDECGKELESSYGDPDEEDNDNE